MIDIRALPHAAIREGRRVATERKASFRALFDDSLDGDLARMVVRARLRKRYPAVPGLEIALAVEEALEP